MSIPFPKIYMLTLLVLLMNCTSNSNLNGEKEVVASVPFEEHIKNAVATINQYNANGEKEGFWREGDRNVSEVYYKNGKLNGLTRHYINGELLCVDAYKDGAWVGNYYAFGNANVKIAYTSANDTAELVNSWDGSRLYKGWLSEYCASGMIKGEGEVIYGYENNDYMPVGIWKYYDNKGCLIKEINQDKPYGGQGDDLMVSDQRSNGNTMRVVKLYRNTGQLWIFGTFCNGVPADTWYHFSKFGHIKASYSQFNMDEHQCYYTEYYNNGDKKREGWMYLNLNCPFYTHPIGEWKQYEQPPALQAMRKGDAPNIHIDKEGTPYFVQGDEGGTRLYMEITKSSYSCDLDVYTVKDTLFGALLDQFLERQQLYVYADTTQLFRCDIDEDEIELSSGSSLCDTLHSDRNPIYKFPSRNFVIAHNQHFFYAYCSKDTDKIYDFIANSLVKTDKKKAIYKFTAPLFSKSYNNESFFPYIMVYSYHNGSFCKQYELPMLGEALKD